LENLLQSDDPMIRRHAEWALNALGPSRDDAKRPDL
jgi:hypothetical protein